MKSCGPILSLKYPNLHFLVKTNVVPFGMVISYDFTLITGRCNIFTSAYNEKFCIAPLSMSSSTASLPIELDKNNNRLFPVAVTVELAISNAMCMP